MNKIFTYIDSSNNITPQMLQQYQNSMIVIGDEGQAFIPILNAYIGGIGRSTYQYILDMINTFKSSLLSIKTGDQDLNYNLAFSKYDPINKTSYMYIADDLYVNPVQGIVSAPTFHGYLDGNSYTTSYLKNTVHLWGNEFHGIEDIEGNIIPSENNSYIIGQDNRQFAYAYISYMIGYLDGHSTTSSYAEYSTYNYQSYIQPVKNLRYYFPIFEDTYTGNGSRFSYVYAQNSTVYSYHIDGKYLGQNESFEDVNYLTNPRAIIDAPLLYIKGDNGTRGGALLSSLFRGNLIGTSSYAYYLWDDRKINGTQFDGSKDIITAYWGNGRNFTIYDYDGTYCGTFTYVRGDQNVILYMPSIANMDITGNSNYALTSTSSNTSYLIYFQYATQNRDYYITFVSNSSTAPTFSYSYTNMYLKYNPSSARLTTSYFNGWLEGISDEAIILHTPRKINGTYFDGSLNITTSYWGYKRNITISDYDNTYSYTCTDIDGGSDIELKLPENIKANLNGNADTAIYAESTYISNQTYRQKFNLTNHNSAYYITISNVQTSYAYMYYNPNLRYIPETAYFETSYIYANELLSGKLRAQDQWGTLGNNNGS